MRVSNRNRLVIESVTAIGFRSGWAEPKCEGCPVYQGLLLENGTAYNPGGPPPPGEAMVCHPPGEAMVTLLTDVPLGNGEGGECMAFNI